MERAVLALNACLGLSARTVLDIGSGDGWYADQFRAAGFSVTTVDYLDSADMVGNYLDLQPGRHDLIWCSHVLEHQPNVGMFLQKCFADLHDGGWICLTVPPAKSEIVGGHLTIWNAGLLLYNMILAGFDCGSASVKRYGYNISVLVRKVRAELPPLAYDFGDIERLAKFFPFDAKQGFDGDIGGINWPN